MEMCWYLELTPIISKDTSYVQVFEEMHPRHMFVETLFIHNTIGMTLIWESSGIETSFQIMVKSTIRKYLILWVNSIDYVVDINHKLESM